MSDAFDVGAVRSLQRRTVFARSTDAPMLVLGSTQGSALVDRRALARHGVALVRRRSGGGAVLLEPERSVWLDTWVPRGDPLWEDDVARSRLWVGEWWSEVLDDGAVTHRGGPVSSKWSDAVCFAGLDAGEVTWRHRKVVGVAQWRGKEGSLTHSMAYVEADWSVVAALLGLGPGAATELQSMTATVAEAGWPDPHDLVDRLIGALPAGPTWDIRRNG